MTFYNEKETEEGMGQGKTYLFVLQEYISQIYNVEGVIVILKICEKGEINSYAVALLSNYTDNFYF